MLLGSEAEPHLELLMLLRRKGIRRRVSWWRATEVAAADGKSRAQRPVRTASEAPRRCISGRRRGENHILSLKRKMTTRGRKETTTTRERKREAAAQRSGSKMAVAWDGRVVGVSAGEGSGRRRVVGI
jgi:hypothetical protein